MLNRYTFTENQKAQWRNKIFKVEIDKENKRLNVISKRKSILAKGFSVELPNDYDPLKHDAIDLEMYIWNRYTHQVYTCC